VNGQAVERSNPTWYQIGAGRYVYSDLVRLTQAPSPSSGEKWIEIILSQQRLIAHEGNRIIMDTKVSTGKPRTPTVTGTFRIYAKYRYKDMRGPGYYLPRVPATMFFYRGYALHGTYWHNNFGHPMSHGCVNMRTSDAWIIFNWAPIGTKVVVHR
jgi:lipoprotein-anchoring transpeptidase ErfK/SrfK